jgi:hypothetical protein
VRAYRLRECWRAERADRQTNNLSQTSSRAEKGKRERARWIRVRSSLHMYLRQATTPTSRRWGVLHAAFEFRLLRVKKKNGWAALSWMLVLVARSARIQQVSPSKILSLFLKTPIPSKKRKTRKSRPTPSDGCSKKAKVQRFYTQQTFCSDLEASTFADAEPKTVFRQALKPKKS